MRIVRTQLPGVPLEDNTPLVVALLNATRLIENCDVSFDEDDVTVIAH